MINLEPIKKGNFVVAVSGGVDSVVLLDLLLKQPQLSLVVAHFDHGMRPDSAQDEQFVAGRAKKYGVRYESGRQPLGSSASEATARRARYSFLAEVSKKYNIGAIITAHHADDVVETMIINLLRGSGWRGLSSLQSTSDILRPLLRTTKQDIITYATAHKLTWREDSTNHETKYLRNQLRQTLMPRVHTKQWLGLYESQLALSRQIKIELEKYNCLRRHNFIMWPPSVAIEVLRSRLSLTRPQAMRVLLAMKTARNGAQVIIGSQRLTFTSDKCVIN